VGPGVDGFDNFQSDSPAGLRPIGGRFAFTQGGQGLGFLPGMDDDQPNCDDVFLGRRFNGSL
jgi:hypothetical protein